MNDTQTMHAMALDDAYRVERVLARGSYGVTELVTLDGAGPFVRKKIPLALVRRDVWAALGECASLRLPHVEATYELPDLYVVIFDYVPGRTLDELVGERGRLDPAQAVSIAMQLCQAASELHRHGIVHRDITPKNVILAADGVHLIDFGIARMRDEEATRDTTALGTWGFAPPEQYGFAQTDARSDVYSIGRLVGFMLAGAYPDDASFDRLLADPGLVPPRLREIIARACAFEPSARQSSTDRLGLELASWNNGEPLPPDMVVPWDGKGGRSVVSASARKRRRIAFAAISAIVTVALVAAGVFWVISLTEPGQPSVGGNVPSAQAPSDGTDGDSSDKGLDVPSSPSGSGTDDATANGNQSADDILEIVDSDWTAPNGYVHYALTLRNTSDTAQVDYPAVNITGRAKDGSVMFADQAVLSSISPGQTVVDAGQVGDGTAPATVEFDAVRPESYNVTQATGTFSFRMEGLSVVPDDSGSVTLAGEVVNETTGKPRGDGDCNEVKVSVVLKDSKERVVYSGMAFVSKPSRGEKVAFSVSCDDAPEYETYEAYAMPW